MWLYRKRCHRSAKVGLRYWDWSTNSKHRVRALKAPNCEGQRIDQHHQQQSRLNRVVPEGSVELGLCDESAVSVAVVAVQPVCWSRSLSVPWLLLLLLLPLLIFSLLLLLLNSFVAVTAQEMLPQLNPAATGPNRDLSGDTLLSNEASSDRSDRGESWTRHSREVKWGKVGEIEEIKESTVNRGA